MATTSVAPSVLMPPPASRPRTNMPSSAAKIAQDIAAGSASTASSTGATGAQPALGQKRRSETEPDRAGGATLTPTVPNTAAPALLTPAWAPASMTQTRNTPHVAMSRAPSAPAWSSAWSAHAPTAPLSQPTPPAPPLPQVQPSAGYYQGSRHDQPPAPAAWSTPVPPPQVLLARPFLAGLKQELELTEHLAMLPSVDLMESDEIESTKACLTKIKLEQQQQWQFKQIHEEYGLAQERIQREHESMIQETLRDCEVARHSLRHRANDDYGNVQQRMQCYEQQLQEQNAPLGQRQELQRLFETEKKLLEENFLGSHGILDQQLAARKHQLQQELQLQLQAMGKELNEKVREMESLHKKQQVELRKDQEDAEEVRKEANEIWQWVVDSFDGQEDKMPLFIYYPEFDSCRLHWSKLYDFLRKMEVDLGKEMAWSAGDDPAVA